jgi:hypothetical protein
MPRRPSRITPVLAAALAAGAIAAPAALGAPAGEPGGNRSVTRAELTALHATPVVERSVHKGFEWGDAAVGAGAATAVLLLGAAGVSAASHRHGRLTTAR